MLGIYVYIYIYIYIDIYIYREREKEREREREDLIIWLVVYIDFVLRSDSILAELQWFP